VEEERKDCPAKEEGAKQESAEEEERKERKGVEMDAEEEEKEDRGSKRGAEEEEKVERGVEKGGKDKEKGARKIQGPDICKCGESPVLIVDDNDFNLEMLRVLIEQDLLITPDQARDGEEALKVFREKWGRVQECPRADCPKRQHRVVFMDLNMPVKDGYDSAAEILAFTRSQDPSRVPKIMALTAFVGKDTSQRCSEIGMVEVLHKPADSGMLVAMVKKHCPELGDYIESGAIEKERKK